MACRRSALAFLLLVTLAGRAAHAALTDITQSAAKPPDLSFNDAWGPKIAGTPDGDNYDPSLVDWASVIQSARVVCGYEMRICNWATRGVFHDAGANTVSTASGTNTQIVVGGSDASLLLTDETLRFENSYENFSTYVASVVRTLVGFYNISYADGLVILGAVAREMLSYGRLHVTTMMPAARDPTTGDGKTQFLVGRLDSSTEDPAGILPPPFIDVEGFVTYYSTHFDYGSNGAHYGVALLGAHGTNDNTGCVKSDSGPYAGKTRMFTWQASNTYFKDLMTAKFGVDLGPPLAPGTPIRSQLDRSDPWPKKLTLSDVMQCTFTSQSFKAEVNKALVAQGIATNPAQNAPPATGPEFSIDWLNPARKFPADTYNGGARPAGIRSWRTCDKSNNCYDGWPYTTNDGHMGNVSQFNNADATPAEKGIRAAVRLFRNNPNAWDAAYAQAFVRLTKTNAKYSPKAKGGKGLPISSWECKTWVSGDGGSGRKNRLCALACKSDVLCAASHYRAPLNCRCSTSPWGEVAKQKLYPDSVQTAVGGIATGGNLGRKLMGAEPAHIVVGPRFGNATVGGGARKLAAAGGSGCPRGGGSHDLRGRKCPMEFLRSKGLLS